MRKLLVNKVKCGQCNDIVESRHRHDFRPCKCGAIYVDGGLEYTRRAGDIFGCVELSEYSGHYVNSPFYGEVKRDDAITALLLANYTRDEVSQILNGEMALFENEHTEALIKKLSTFGYY